MLKINLKLALRNIFRNKLYSAINVAGLSVASAFCILVYFYVKNEQSFDNFHKGGDRLYRVEQTDLFGSSANRQPKKNFFSFLMKDAEQVNMIQTPTELGPKLEETFPEIEAATRLEGLGGETIRIGNRSFKEQNENLTFADDNFFEVFNYPLLKGDKASVLKAHNTAAISERLAIKYFGTTDAVGRVFSMPNEAAQPPLTVTGVFKNFPLNSSFQYDMVIPVKSNSSYKENLARGNNSFSDPLIIELKKGTDVVNFNQKLRVFSARYFHDLLAEQRKHDPKGVHGSMDITLRPFSEAHYNQAMGWNHYTDLKGIYQLMCIGAVILFIACLNYILLTLTNTISRSQDVGVRKTIGAGRRAIIFQYYSETQLLAFLSVIAGFLVAAAVLPFFGSLTGTPIELSSFSILPVFAFLALLGLVLGLLAGIYPALTMSGLKPLNIMRGFSSYRLNPVLSKFLVVMQFTVCIILVISTLVINKQIHYINETDMGFNKDQVLIVQSPYGWDAKKKTLALKQRMEHYAATEPAIQDITAVSIVFGGFNNNGFFINGGRIMLQAPDVDYNYFSFLHIPIVKGRSFSKDISSDTAKLNLPGIRTAQSLSLAMRYIVVNETLYKLLGKPQLDVVNPQMGGIIIGVCKDYHTQDLTQKIQPAYHTLERYTPFSFWIKIKAGQSIPQAVKRIRNNWNVLTASAPFDYTFLDQEVAKNYDAYLRWMKTVTIACVLAIIIACMGLFGLSGITTINRMKEIGIRKVLGASVTNLFVLLNRSTILLAACSFLIAAPVAFYLVHSWLDNFAYRITPDWSLFALAGLIALSASILAVSYHTIKSAIANPVDSLRSE